ncbi:MAG: hypothetical protein LBR06_08015 [Bacteroidales bacterium]|jgi:acyl carrier protein|nr:hypothetical protein [Bacteroidales bacterium]
MSDRILRKTLYRVLRKTGVPRNNIELTASFSDDLNFDHIDWAIFLYHMEVHFNIALDENQVAGLAKIEDSLRLLQD